MITTHVKKSEKYEAEQEKPEEKAATPDAKPGTHSFLLSELIPLNQQLNRKRKRKSSGKVDDNRRKRNWKRFHQSMEGLHVI